MSGRTILRRRRGRYLRPRKGFNWHLYQIVHYRRIRSFYNSITGSQKSRLLGFVFRISMAVRSGDRRV